MAKLGIMGHDSRRATSIISCFQDLHSLGRTSPSYMEGH